LVFSTRRRFQRDFTTSFQVHPRLQFTSKRTFYLLESGFELAAIERVIGSLARIDDVIVGR